MNDGAMLIGVLTLCIGLIKYIKDLLVGNSKSQRECDEEILRLEKELLLKGDQCAEWRRRAIIYRKKYQQTDQFIKTYLTKLRQPDTVKIQTDKGQVNVNNKRKSD